jgi:hypothetical protein
MNAEKLSPKPTNDIRDLRSLKELARVRLDLDSPRLRKACYNLGIQPEELKNKTKDQFEEKDLPKDVVELRYKVKFE